MSKLASDLKKLNVEEPNKVYFLGKSGAGKTSLCRLICFHEFKDKIPGSRKAINIYNSIIDGKKITLKDLTDDDEGKCMKIFFNEIVDVKCIFIMFSLTDKKSFEYADKITNQVMENLRNNSETQVYILGNKYDIVKDFPNQRQVTEEEIDTFLINHFTGEPSNYTNISCKTAYNIDIIKNIIHEIEAPESDNEEEEEAEEDKEGEEHRPNTQSSCQII